MTSSQSTPCGYGSRIALRLCGTTAVDLVCRHCERSEAIHRTSATKMDCFAALAMTGVATAGQSLPVSFPDVQLHIVDAPWRRPGIHNHGWGLWIPDSMLRIRPGMTAWGRFAFRDDGR